MKNKRKLREREINKVLKEIKPMLDMEAHKRISMTDDIGNTLTWEDLSSEAMLHLWSQMKAGELAPQRSSRGLFWGCITAGTNKMKDLIRSERGKKKPRYQDVDEKY